jgi:hypothetical protein
MDKNRDIRPFLYSKRYLSETSQDVQKLSREDQIKVILEETDFNKIQSVMTFLGWSWFDASAPDKIPNVDELKEEAKRLLEDAYDDNNNESYSYIATGGFTATRLMYDGIKMLSLDFSISGWNLSYYDVTSENYE